MLVKKCGNVIRLTNELEQSKENRIIELLEEMVKWTRVTSIPFVRNFLTEILQKDEHKAAYHYSDGVRTREEIGNLVNVSGPTISNWWKKWIRTGIAELLDVQGGTRGRRLFQLEDFDIQIPNLNIE